MDGFDKSGINYESDLDLVYLQESINIIQSKIESLDDVLQTDQKKAGKDDDRWFKWLRKKEEPKTIEPKSNYEIIEGWIYPILMDLDTLLEEYRGISSSEGFIDKYSQNIDIYNSILLFIFNKSNLLIDNFYRRVVDWFQQDTNIYLRTLNFINLQECIDVFIEIRNDIEFYLKVYELVQKFSSIIYMKEYELHNLKSFIENESCKETLLDRIVELKILEYSDDVIKLIEQREDLYKRMRELSDKYRKYETVWGDSEMEKERDRHIKNLINDEWKVYKLIFQAKREQFNKLLSES